MVQRPLNLIALSERLNERIDFIEKELEQLRDSRRSIDLSELGFLDGFYLYCVLVASGDDWCGSDLPSSALLQKKLAPTRLLTDQIYLRLQAIGILVPSLCSPISAFNVSSLVDAPIQFDCTRVHWTIPVGILQSNKAEILAALQASFSKMEAADIRSLRSMLIQHEFIARLSDNAGALHILSLNKGELGIASFLEEILHNRAQNAAANSFDQLCLDVELIKEIFGPNRRGRNAPELNDLIVLLHAIFASESISEGSSSSLSSLIQFSTCVASTKFLQRFRYAA